MTTSSSLSKRTAKSRAPGAKFSNDVDALVASLQHPLSREIEALRAIIRAADPRVVESVKWNAPSFSLADHFATLKLYPPDNIQVVLHTGTKVKREARALRIKDPAGLLEWAAPDRALVTFRNLADVRAKRAAFAAVLKQWIKQIGG